MRRLSILAVLLVIVAAPAGALAQNGSTVRADINYFGLYYPQSAVGFYAHRSFDQVRVGYSARSVAMGGTHLAFADDPTAVATNPAALSRVVGTQVVADGYARSGGGTSSDFPAEFNTPFGPLPVTGMIEKPGSRATYGFFGASHAVQFDGRDLVLGLAYRRFLDTTNPLQTTIEFTVQASGEAASTNFANEVRETGGVDAVAPSVGLTIVPGVSVGATANFIMGKIQSDIKQTVTVLGQNFGTGEGSVTQHYGGFAVTLGGLAEFDHVAVGATVTPKYKLEARKGKYFIQQLTADIENPSPRFEGNIRDYDLEVPLFASAGVSVRPVKNLVVAADYYYRPWSDARLHHGGDATDEELLAETILPWNAGDDFWGDVNGLDDIHEALRRPGLEDASSFHIGAEYELLHRHLFGVPYVMPVRAGFHTMPQTYVGVDPSDTLSVAEDGDGLFRDKQVEGSAITGGLGLTMEKVSFDISYRRTSEELTRWFIVTNTSVATPDIPRVGSTRVTRNSTEFRLTTTLRF